MSKYISAKVRQAAEIDRLNQLVALLRQHLHTKNLALENCATVFRQYEKLHHEKGTPEAEVKAMMNGLLAQMAEKALSFSD